MKPRLESFNFAEQTTTLPAWVETALKSGPLTMKKAGKPDRVAEDTDEVLKAIEKGYSLPEAPQNSPTNGNRVSRSRAKTDRAGAVRTSRNAQANSLRIPDWAEIGEEYECEVLEFQDVYELVNGVQAETPKFSQCKLETVVDGEKVAFSILFSEKLPDIGQETTLKCVKDETGRTQSGKNWIVQ